MRNSKTVVQFQVSEMSPAVFQDFKDGYKILRVMAFVAKNGIVVMTTGSHIGNPKSIFLGSQFSSLLL